MIKKKRTDERGRKDVMGRTGRRAAAACLLAALLCAGCGEADGMMSDVADPGGAHTSQSMTSDALNGGYEGGIGIESAGADSLGAPGDGTAGDNVDVTVDTDRKLIKTVSLSAETREFEQAMAALETQVRQLGGYIEKLETYNGSQYSGSRSKRYSYMTVRIPRENLDGFLETVSGVCNVTRRNDDLKDVTLTYVDIESRRDTLRTEQERLLSFLEKAQTVEEIIALEERLSEVRYQLESMEARLRTIDNQVDFATVNLDISEVLELTLVEEPTVWERLAGGFMDSVGNIGGGFLDFCIWFVINTPYFAVWAVIITGLVLIIRRSGRRKKEKMLAQAAKADAEWKAGPGSGTAQDNAKQQAEAESREAKEENVNRE